MSELTEELVAALKEEHEGQFDDYGWSWHTHGKDPCPTCALILRAEQTPVPSGRVISEEEIKVIAHEEMLEYVDMGCFKDWKFALHLLEQGFFFGYSNALRTAPQATMPTQGYSRDHVIGAWKNGWNYRGVSEDLMVPLETLIDEYLATITEGGKS